MRYRITDTITGFSSVFDARAHTLDEFLNMTGFEVGVVPPQVSDVAIELHDAIMAGTPTDGLEAFLAVRVRPLDD